MGVLLLAIILSIGFIYTNTDPASRFRQKRATGWNSYFHIAQHGIIYSALGCISVFLLILVLNLISWLLDLFPLLAGSEYRFPALGTLIFSYALPTGVAVGSVASLILASLIAYGKAVSQTSELENDFTKQMEEYEKLAKTDGLEHLLFQSMKNESLVRITMKSRKVYIGKVTQPRFMHGDFENIIVLPMLSGYRDKDSLKYVEEHSYSNHYKQNNITPTSEPLNLDHFRIVIPCSEIETVSLFDSNTYAKFRANERAREVKSSINNKLKRKQIV